MNKTNISAKLMHIIKYTSESLVLVLYNRFLSGWLLRGYIFNRPLLRNIGR